MYSSSLRPQMRYPCVPEVVERVARLRCLGFSTHSRNFARQARKTPRRVQWQGFGDPLIFRVYWRNPIPWQCTQVIDEVPIDSERFHSILSNILLGFAFGLRNPFVCSCSQSRPKSKTVNKITNKLCGLSSVFLIKQV